VGLLEAAMKTLTALAMAAGAAVLAACGGAGIDVEEVEQAVRRRSCGDGACSAKETCSTCATDCCPPAPPTATATPTLTPAPGTYTSAQSVTLSAATGATIYYTTDGSTPTTTMRTYVSPILVGTTTTIKAMAVAPGYEQSAVASGTYDIQPATTQVADPTFDPPPGAHHTCDGSLPVFLSVATVGAAIHYTLDGSTPSSSSEVVQSRRPPEYPPWGFVDVAQDFQGYGTTTTIRAIAVKSGLSDSDVVGGTYTVYSNPDLEWCCDLDPQYCW
jgi:hypothetical protein